MAIAADVIKIKIVVPSRMLSGLIVLEHNKINNG